MARRRRAEPPGPAGFLVVDKPAGWTSHDVVDAARRWFGTRRVGHLGTLDPQATGVLPLAVREATKLITFLEDSEKSYEGRICFGVETDTLDGEGRVLKRHSGSLPDEAAVRAALAGFRGEIEQVPPMFSAVKQGGVPLHRLARRGVEVERAPKTVVVHRLELLAFESEGARARISVDCSPGTYVRCLAADLGAKLGCGAFLESLRRLRSGPFAEAEALDVGTLERLAGEGNIGARLISPARVLGLPTWTPPEAGARRVRNGGDLPPSTNLKLGSGDRIVALDSEGRALALLELRPDRRLWPLRVLLPPES